MQRFLKSCVTVALIALVFSCGSAPLPEGLALTDGSAGLLTPRERMALVRLADGRVLAVGGFNGAYTLASCEVYEPSTGQWVPTGALRTARRNHAAVALADGRVLVVGGTSGRAIGALASAEVYEPATGTWTAVASMGAARNDPAAVLLADGRVLVAGGTDVDLRPVRGAELFHPATGTWTPAEAPGFARGGSQTAVLLADGRALFVSGLQAEVYEPATGQWARAGALGGAAGTHRHGHSVTRLADGRVLVVGGNTTRASTTAEVYEPATGEWTLVAPPSLPRELHGAVATGDGAVWVVGGSFYTSGALADVERFEPATGTWSAVAPLRTARRSAGVVALDSGELLLVGGGNEAAGTLASTERYLPDACALGACVARAEEVRCAAGEDGGCEGGTDVTVAAH